MHLGIKVSANPDLRRFCIQVDVFHFIFLTLLHRERRSLLYCFTPAGRLCIQFTFTKTHVQVLQSGIFSLPGATVHWIHDQNRGSFSLRHERRTRTPSSSGTQISGDLRWSSFHSISWWRRVGHSRHQTTRVTKTEALLWLNRTNTQTFDNWRQSNH